MIDIENLKVGDFLSAKNQCIMDITDYFNKGKPALIIGKKYPILYFNPFVKCIFIKSEVDSRHCFQSDDINQFFEQ